MSTGPTPPTDPPQPRSASRFLIPLGLGVIAVVVLEAGLGPVGFGVSGRPLLLTVASAAYAVAGYAFLRGVTVVPVWVLLAVMTVAMLAMYVADPDGPVIGLFLIAAVIPLRPPLRGPTVILVVGTVAYNLVQLFLASEMLLVTIATDAGVAFFFLVGTMLRREREQREELARLMAELAESRRAEQAAIVVAERARLAQDLHDVLAHTLSGLALQLEGANLLATSTPADPRLVDTVRRAHQLSKSGLAEARRAVGALRGEQLPGPEQIPDLVAEHRFASRGSVRFGETGSPEPLSPEAGLALYRAAQEALSNVRKHAGNADVDVGLVWADDQVELTVADTGNEGIVSSGGSGYGLSGMAERVHAVGGSVEAAALAGRGFRVCVILPTAGQVPADHQPPPPVPDRPGPLLPGSRR
jgi:signal transduction histidine kinase